MRKFSGGWGRVVTGYSVFVAAFHILQVFGVFSGIEFHMLPQPFRAGSLGLFLVLVFIYYPLQEGRPRDWWWLDAALIAGTLLSCGYYLFAFETVIWSHFLDAQASTVDIIAGLIIILAILESARRTQGWTLVLIVVFFLVHALYGGYFPGPFHSRNYPFARIMFQLLIGNTGLWGIELGVASTIIVMFVLFGSFLRNFGVGNFFNDLAFSLLGSIRGGPAKGAIVASALFGMISGSTAANVATVGSFTIPLMKKVGYPPIFAAAVEAVASNGGQIMPPVMGVIAFIMAEFLGIPYAQVCVAAIIPAAMYFLCLFVAVDVEAVMRGLHGLPGRDLPSFTKIVRNGWYHIVPLLALIIFLGPLGYTPAKAALFALGAIVVIAAFTKQSKSILSLGGIAKSLSEGSTGMLVVVPACAVAGLVMGSLGLTGLGYRLSSVLLELAGDHLLLLLFLTAISSFVLGTGMPSIPCYVILAVLVAPALVKMGCSPMASHFFIFFWGIVSLITPPVAVAAYVAAAIADTDPWDTGWVAVRLGAVAFIVPFAFMYDEGFFLRGPLLQIIVAVISGGVSSMCLAWGLWGHDYTWGKLKWGWRSLYLISGTLLLFPGWWVKSIGFGITATIIVCGRLLRNAGDAKRSPA